MADTDELWGGVITALTFDPTMWRLVLQVAVAEADHSKKYEVTLDEISDLRLTRGIDLP